MDKALGSPPVIDLQAPSALSEFIGRLERSPRSDHNLIAAIVTIERESAERFLSILGPPPASEERLQAAFKVMGRALRHG